MFKFPSNIAQDLLLIHDLVSEPVSGPSYLDTRSVQDAKESLKLPESVDSSYESSDSEEVDVVESLLTGPDSTGEDVCVKMRSPSPSSSESSSEDSDSDSDTEFVSGKPVGLRGMQTIDDFEEDGEEEGGVHLPSSSMLRTKNELSEASIVTPDITEIDAEEPLEKVGEVMSVIENVVVVKGLASRIENKASEHALDSESLLVFENRKVLGYIHETFGPTHQPLYQVKFHSAASIDKELVTISREVFHVPLRSHFVFPSQLKKIKGSDASNVHDEEVNEDEMEFSDDEAETAFKQQRKRRREGNREASVSSSRFSTPTPSQMHDHELNDSFYGASPYDEYGPYDLDSAPGPSRPSPLPYDDPYQDEPSSATSDSTPMHTREDRPRPPEGPRNFMYANSRGRGRGRGRERGRGRGRGREYGGRGGFGGSGGDSRRLSGDGSFYGASPERRNRRSSFSRGSDSGLGGPRSLSPTSMAIARATGQYTDSSTLAAQQQVPLSPPSSSTSAYGYWQQQDAAYGMFSDTSQQAYGAQQTLQHQTYTQPHINPRFASLFGINMNFMQGQQYNPYLASNSPVADPHTAHTPSASWTVSGWSQDVPEGNLQPSTANEHSVQRKSDSEEYHP